MKSYSGFYRSVSLTCILMILSTSCLTFAQQANDTTQAIVDAKTDAEISVGWFAGTFLTSIAFGCLGGSVLIAASQVVSADPPISRLMGKSPDYVIAYTNTYKKEIKTERLIHTSLGCVGGSAIAAWLAIAFNLYDF